VWGVGNYREPVAQPLHGIHRIWEEELGRDGRYRISTTALPGVGDQKVWRCGWVRMPLLNLDMTDVTSFSRPPDPSILSWSSSGPSHLTGLMCTGVMCTGVKV
jgi:hypothetical protein